MRISGKRDLFITFFFKTLLIPSTTSLPLPQHQPQWEAWPITFAFALRPLRPTPGTPATPATPANYPEESLDNVDNLARMAADVRAQCSNFGTIV
jgi:hypothetical protein